MPITENHNLVYVWVVLASLAGPLVFSFLPQIKFYKYWLYAFGATIIVSLLFLPWDVYFTHYGIWGFNSAYVIGLDFWQLPLEEISFFVIIPFASIFVYECVAAFSFFPKSWYLYTISPLPLRILSVVCFCLFWMVADQAYTASVLGGSAILFCVYSLPSVMPKIDWGRFILAYIIVLIPMSVVNGVLTALPVVWYDDTENLGVRIGSIPIEDFGYQWILFSLNVLSFNYLKLLRHQS